MRQKIARHVHQIDHGRTIRHRHVHVHAENQQRTRQLPHFFHDILVAFARRDDLIDPTGKWMGARGRDLQAAAFGRADQFAARAAHIDIEFAHVLANFRADFDDGLVHLRLHLLAKFGGGRHQFGHVRTQLARGGIHNLKFFFDADGEPVIHGQAPSGPGYARTARVSYREFGGNHILAVQVAAIAGRRRRYRPIAASRLRNPGGSAAEACGHRRDSSPSRPDRPAKRVP